MKDFEPEKYTPNYLGRDGNNRCDDPVYKKQKLDFDDMDEANVGEENIEEENIEEYFNIERDYRLKKFLSGKSSLF